MKDNFSLLFKVLIVIILLTLYLCCSAYAYAETVSSNLGNNILRLHIIANSDLDQDQALKLKVRDTILDYLNNSSVNLNNKSEAINFVNSHIDELRTLAEETISDEGFSYPVSLTITNCTFPTKKYGNISIPSGEYDALRIQIGNAAGQNWWCVLFPPLCFVDISSGVLPDNSKELLKDSLEDEEYELITADLTNSESANLKFKIVELVENIKSIL